MIYNFIYKWSLKCLLVLIIFTVSSSGYGQDYKNEKQLIKGANDQFNAKNYKEAIPLFSTLVSNYSKDPTYNYKYGASLLYGGTDKEKPIKYLKFSVSRPEVEPIAYFYYAEALHLNYEFDQAIKYYKKFTNSANNSTIKNNTVENQIRQCQNGKTLLKTITDLIVLDQKNTLVKDFYKVYDLSAQGGQILVKTDEFRSPYEIKNNINGLFYFPKNAEKIFFSSHTFENKNGKDIYYAVRNADATWSKPVSLGKSINTEFNEDFPYMSADGTTLYFASEGHNSLGGYDIFVARLDTGTGSWTKPQNLDFAINTPANDYLFIPNLSGETAYFASERQTPRGEVSVYQINMERVPLDFTFIFGTFSSETTKNAKIKVENAETNAIIGEYSTDANGKYKIKLPNDGKFRFLVDYEGSEVTHSGEVDLQERNTFKPLKQEMLVMGQGTENEKLIIKNLVDEEVEEDIELTAEFFKEKAKLKVNKDKYKDRKPKLTTPVGGAIAASSVVPTSTGNSAIAESAEHAGKAGTDISAEKIISDPTGSSDGPNLTVNEETESVDPGLAEESGPQLVEEGTTSSQEGDNGSSQVTASQIDAKGNVDSESIAEASEISNKSETGNDVGSSNGSSADNNSGSANNSGNSSGSGSSNGAGGAITGANGLGAATAGIAAASAVNLKPSATSSKEEIESSMQDNVKVAENSAKMVAIQSESAQNVSDRKSSESEQLKAEANNELALIDIETEDGLNSPEYLDAQVKLEKAEKLDRQAKVAQDASSSLTNSRSALEQTVATGTQKQSNLDASNAAMGSAAVGDYNALIETEADQTYNIYDEREKAEAAHKKEEKKHKHFADEFAALNSEIEDSEQIIAQKEAAIESAGGKEKKALEEGLINERAALTAMQEKSRADEQELIVLENEAKEEEAELDAFDAIIEELERNESYKELAVAPNLIDGPGSVNENRSTGSNMLASSGSVGGNSASGNSVNSESENGEHESSSSTEIAETVNSTGSNAGNSEETMTIAEKVAIEKTEASSNSNEAEEAGIDLSEAHEDVQGANENSAEVIGTVEHESGEEMIAQKRTSSSQEEVDMLDNVISAPLAVAVVPAKYASINKTVPEIDSKMALFPDMEEGDTLSVTDKELMPEEGNSASAFIPENALASLENEDQSMRSQMKSNYHLAYMEEFFELAEEEDEYTKSVNTYVLNQSWVLDIEKEVSYLESIKGDVPADKYTVVQERINVLEDFRDTKLNDLESSKERLDEMSPSGDQNAGEIATEYRSEMNRVFEGKRRLSAEDVATEEQRREDVQAQRKSEMAQLVAQNEAEAQAIQNAGTENTGAENESGSGSNSESEGNQEGDLNPGQNESNGGSGSNSEENALAGNNSLADNQNSNQTNTGSGSNNDNVNGSSNSGNVNPLAPLMIASVPAKYATVSKEVPEVDAEMALFPDLEEGDSLSIADKELLPTEGNSASAFIPENALAGLENTDQSIQSQMKTNYHLAYMEEFSELAEEEDAYTKSVNTYALNQSYVLDIEKEIAYLESVKGDVPEEKFTVVQERITALEGFKETKLNDLESSKERLDAAAPSGDQNAGEIATEFRTEMNSAFEEKASLSAEQIAQNSAESQSNQNGSNENAGEENEADQNLNSESVENQEGNSDNASNEGSESNSEDNSSTSNNSLTEQQGSNEVNSASGSEEGNTSNDNPTNSGSNTTGESAGGSSNANNGVASNNQSNNESAGAAGNTEGNNTQNVSSNSGGQQGNDGSISNGANNVGMNAVSGTSSVAYADNGEIIPNQKEDKLASVLNMENTGTVEAIVTNYTDEVEKEETAKKAVIESERIIIEEKQKEYDGAKKKRKRVLEAEIREEEQIVELMEQETTMLQYNKEAVARAADNVLGLEAGEERDSEKELKKAETVTAQAAEVRTEAETKAIEKVRGKKKTIIKLAEVDDLNHKADKLDYEANSLKKLSKELAKIEDEVLAAEQGGSGAVTLPKPTRQISQAEVQEVQSSKDYQEYDASRKEAVKTYKAAQVLYSEKMSLEAQNKVIDAEIQNVESDIESATDEAQKEEFSDKMDELVTSKVENTKLLNQKENQAKKKYSQYAKLNSNAIKGLRSIEGVEGEKLIALANLAETQGAYSLTGSGNNALIAGNDGTTETGYSTDKFNRVVQGIDNYPARLSDAIFKMIDFNESLYSEVNPIPMNNTMPTGLVYKVQIGAFRNPPPQDIYKGFAPVRGENTRPGWIRYTAGLFQQKNQAQLKRNEIRTLGYEDAFVVAYLNGERISLSRAKDIETGVEKVPESSGNALAAGGNPISVVPTSAVSGEVKQLSDIKGLMYTVQVGAFRNQVTSNELYGISPLIEYLAGEYYKYGSGVYNDINKASDAKSKIQALGVSDAFVTAFYNGNRVSMDEASKLANGGTSFATEQPITVNTPSGNNSAGINFRVQVGAYRQEVPVEDAKVILSLSNIGLDTKVDSDITYYTAGNYGSYAEAKQMQTQVANQGLSGAFVVALQNGQKIDLQEAIKLTGQ